MKNTPNSARFLDLFGILVTGIFGGATLGVLSNLINGLVSPIYFVNIMGWGSGENIWRASLFQGAIEGLVLGLILSVIFTTLVTIVTRARCPYSFGAGYMARIFIATFLCGLAGSFFAVTWSLLFPNSYRDAIIGVPLQTLEMVKYAWVGGSIMGTELGAIVCTFGALVLFPRSWKLRTRSASE